MAFLPTFSRWSTPIGIPLYYGLISPQEVHENTVFSWNNYFRFEFFNYTEAHPIKELIGSIKSLDLSKETDYMTFLSYNIQYIITINSSIQPGGVNNWKLIKSLQESELVFSNQSVYETERFVIWRIY